MVISDDVIKTLIDKGTWLGSIFVIQYFMTRRSEKKIKRHVDTSNERAIDKTVEKVNEKVDEVKREVRESSSQRASQVTRLMQENAQLGGTTTLEGHPVTVEPEVRQQR